MTPLFKKLNYKDQPVVLVVDAPASFAGELENLEETTVVTEPDAVEEVPFALLFVISRAGVDRQARLIVPKLADDAVCWFCYPKKSSKRYRSDITRDTGWTALGELGLEPVRQVAIDADWSALRFRHVNHIKSLTRRAEMALSKAAKARLEQEK